MSAVPDPNSLPSWAKSTSGRSGASYRDFLAANPGFDPYTNLETYTGPGGSQSAAAQQAFGWLNEWARNNGYGDGSRIPPAQRGQMYLAFLERARQGMADRGEDWGQDAASRIPNSGWGYTPGWGLANGGQSWETRGAGGGTTGGGPGGRDTKGSPPAGGGGTAIPNPLGNAVLDGAATVTGGRQTGGNTVESGFENPGGINPGSLAQLAGNPEALWRAYAAMAGIPVAGTSDAYQALKRRLMPQLAAYVDAQGYFGGGPQDASKYLGGLAGSMKGNTLFSTMQDTGRRALDYIAGGGLGDTAMEGDVDQAIQRAMVLGLSGKNRLQQAATLGAYDQMGTDYDTSGLLDPTGAGLSSSPNIQTYMQGTRFWQLAKQLGLA